LTVTGIETPPPALGEREDIFAELGIGAENVAAE
jgi:hypothetical protein